MVGPSEMDWRPRKKLPFSAVFTLLAFINQPPAGLEVVESSFLNFNTAIIDCPIRNY